MTGSHVIPVRAVVSANERGIVAAAADQLSRALQEATGEAWSCHCDYPPSIEALSDTSSDSIILISLTGFLEPSQIPWSEIENRLRNVTAKLAETGAPIMICTIFRHVDATSDPEKAALIRRNLRRLNLLAIELSQACGTLVIDIDRVLADVGGRRLGTDYRLQGATALDVTGKAIASCIIANALDAFASVEAQDSARAILERDRAVPGMAPEIKMTNVMTLGRGRRKQLVSTVTDSVQENHVVWQLRQLLSGQIGAREAADKLLQAVRRRGAKESAGLLFSGILRLFSRQVRN